MKNAMDNNERINILRFVRGKNTGLSSFFKIMNKYGSITKFVNNFDNYNNVKGIELASVDEVLEEIEKTEKINAKIITYLDNDYPQYLKNIGQFPPVLTVRGNYSLLNCEKVISIVGSRNTSINNFNFTKKIANELGMYGYKIVSGLARGVDSAAHIGSLKTGTIAVVAGGIDNIYPKENENIYYSIIENDGLIVSENYLGCPPRPEYFPSRNRIVAGLSKGVLVVDAGLVSGSLNTAKQAIKFNRELMVFPGSPYDERCLGSNKLLQQGANLVLDTKDIIENLEQFTVSTNFNDNVVDFDSDEQEKESVDLFSCLNDSADSISESIISKLDLVPVNINDIIEDLSFAYNVGDITAEIMKLELENKIIVENNKISIKK